MQLKKTPSSFSTFSSKNISDQQLLQKAIQKQISFINPTIEIVLDNKLPQVFTFTPKLNIIKSKDKSLRKIDIVQQQELKKMKMKGNNRIGNNYFPVYTTLMDSEFFKNNQFTKEEVSDQNYQNNKFSERKSMGEKTIYQRKKLIPIKRSKNDKKLQARNVHVSFLKVQKAPFLYQDLKGFDKDSLTITTTTFSKNKFLISRKSFQSTQASNKYAQNIITKQKLNRIAKNRPFVPAFQRYYYFDFVWKIAYSNGLKLQFVEAESMQNKKFKAYVGYGNNSNLIKTLLKRRNSWWTITDKIQQANFIWTQIKVNNIFNSQNKFEANSIFPQLADQIIAKSIPYRKNRKIMNQRQTVGWMTYFHQNREIQQKLTSNFDKRTRMFNKYKLIKLQSQKIKIHNHLPCNYLLGNKKALFATMKRYYQACKKNVFQYLPLTFHIQKNLQDPQYFAFLKNFYVKDKQSKNSNNRNIWIVKPGQFTNRGNGIIVCQTLQQIKSIIKNKVRLDNGNDRTYIVQEYLDRPFLYYGRKFDIRHYMLITYVNGNIKGYWCDLGYIRTTSYQYTINNSFSSVHLTNDAVQKNLPDYGKYQRGNKLSYHQFQTYLKQKCSNKYSFFNTIYPQMKNIAYDSMKASSLFLDPQRRGHNFEIFGFDFMIDSKFHPWLIQINTNPCLQLSSPVLMDVIPQMVQNALKIGLDSILPPPQNFQQKRARFSNNVLQDNCFQLLYDSSMEQQHLRKILEEEGKQLSINFKQLEKDQQQVYQNDGILLED